MSIYVGLALAAQHETRSLDEMLRMSTLCREAIITRDPDMLRKIGLVLVPDRREAERRGSPRVGRRMTDVR